MYKDSAAKCYENNKERLENKACQRYQILSKEEKGKKGTNMVVNDKTICRKMQYESLLCKEKNIIKCEKDILL